MPRTKRGIVPARKHLLPLIVLIGASMPLAARADSGIVDVRTLPRLEGAVEDTSRTQSHSLSYGVGSIVAITTEATKKLIAADGWVQFLRPLDEKSTTLTFKKAQQGLSIHFTQGLGRPDQSVVNYNSDRITSNVPFPPQATGIVFDQHRPYLGCIAPAPFDATLDFFRKEMAAIGWKQLTAADVAARWPNAGFNETVENGVRTYYAHADGDGFYRQRPVMLTLQRRSDGQTGVEIRVALFALPETLEADSEMAGLPRPKPTKTAKSLGGSDSVRRQVEVAVIAELPATLAFYRRELASRNWTEETKGAVVTPDNVTLNFSSAEQTATLTLGRKYDLTVVTLVTQMTEAALAARARAKKEADARFMNDAAALAKQVIAADAARRVAQATNLSDAPLRALADNATPVPLPENAEDVKFDGADGRLEFNSASSVKAVAAFYRSSLQSQGWRERPSVINQPNMAVMEFSKGRKALSLTAMQMGPKVRVSADGSALVVANAVSERGKASSESSSKTVDTLEPDPDSALPVPKQRTMTSIGTGKMPGSDAPFRKELEASIPAELNTVLAFYRSELGKRGWQETEGAVVKPDRAQLAFTSSDGPATLKLGRRNGETTVNLAQKYPAAASKADIVPKPGQSKLMFGNIGKSDATISINKQTIKVAAGAGGPQSARPPMIDLPPGKYQYALKIAGGPARNNQIEIGAGDTWGVMIGPGGDVLPLQMY
ncbi:hypothetical protein CQ12_12470 [Bradyrhizobium jicamae]|uniref:Uncharacterized protein n=1 Tax=Bradyrhizobium jicamae TaxID=280332 RepID=A0A0R3L6Q5_9BRAD|nr:hypothetical protein [Bradyrhizobium jicamae]KRR03641.1 hypothetical protein CQ12_12470 [Bradyrhizobium jicamae]